MASSGYTPWSVTAGEVPTTAYWNLLGANDASFNTGSGINDNAIISRHVANHAITKNTTVYFEVGGPAYNIGTTWTTIWTGNSFTTSGGDILVSMSWGAYRSLAGGGANFRIQLNGSAYYPSITGTVFSFNQSNTHVAISRTYLITGLPASTYALDFQAQSIGSGTTTFDGNDIFNCVTTEFLR